jgi:hypothetical protein
MPDRSSKRPRDPNQLAHLTVAIATGEASDPDSKKTQAVKNTAAVALGRLGGIKGGAARAAKLTPEERSAAASRAAAARWNRDR